MSKSPFGLARLPSAQAQSRIRLGLGRSLANTKDRHRAFLQEYKIQIQKSSKYKYMYKAGCPPLKICKPQICSRAPFPSYCNCFLPTSLSHKMTILCAKTMLQTNWRDLQIIANIWWSLISWKWVCNTLFQDVFIRFVTTVTTGGRGIFSCLCIFSDAKIYALPEFYALST